jgi:hypothetical protein
MLAKSIQLRSLLQGVFWGGLTGAVIISLHAMGLLQVLIPAWGAISHWFAINLGYSTPVFALILLAYALIWQRIHRSLQVVNVDVWEQMVHDEQLLELLTGLAFGVGVIWTALGMREALMAAFGEQAISLSASQGALAMLDNLINGGILTALTSTVVGGVLGYLLRIFKTVTLGRALNRYQDQVRHLISDKPALNSIQ